MATVARFVQCQLACGGLPRRRAGGYASERQRRETIMSKSLKRVKAMLADALERRRA